MNAYNREYFRELMSMAGDLSWMLWEQQRPIYDAIRSMKETIDEFVVLCSRQYGKSHVGVLLAVEDAIRYRDRCILIIGPDTKQTKEIVNPRMRRIQSLLPEGLLVPSKAENKWILYHDRKKTQKNFSEIVIGGMNENSSSQRGKTVQNIYLEESGLANPDDYVDSLRSDLGPALTHSDRGKIIHLTTPPKIPDHPFNLETWTTAEMNGAIVTFTIHDNKKLTQAQFEACVRRSGGITTDDFKREYLCQRIRDASLVVVPSFSEKNIKKFMIPPFTKWNIMFDWGGVRDYTVGLLYTYDYLRDKICFHKEFMYKENTPTNVIWPDIKKWIDDYQVSLDRVRADAPGQTLVDLAILAKAEAIALPNKDDWQAGLNNLNMKCGVGQIEISPDCPFTIQSMRSGTFNKNRTDFERTKALGHCDGVAAMMYAIRHFDVDNPYPITSGYHDNHFIPKRADEGIPLTGMVGKSFV